MHPDSYCAVRVAVEFAKCPPIGPDHHKTIHKGELPNLLADPYYQHKHTDFHSQMIEMMPARFYNKVMSAMIMQPVVV